MKFFIFLAGGLLTLTTVQAQNFTDAMRYSQLAPQGTARALSIGGAVGAVGADFNALSVNPAGIGLYRRSEFTFSPSIRANSVSGSYQKQTTEDNAGAFSISNLGYVGVSAPNAGNNDFGRGQQQSSSWKSWGFAVGLNRVADFNRTYTYKGRNDSSSVSEAFVLNANGGADAQGQILTNTIGFLGYDTYLLDYDSVSGYFTNADYQLGALNQERTVRERGGITEMLLTFGGNNNEKLMLGGTLGIPLMRYVRTSTFTETDADNTMPQFERSDYYEDLRATGAGINLKVGAIYKPSDAFRVGLAIHSPTWLSVQESFSRSLTNNVVGYQNISGPQSASLDQNDFSYTIQTAWRGVLSAMVFAGNWGFLSADYEYVGYGDARLIFETAENGAAFGNGAFAEDQRIRNEELRANVNNASNLRIGGEGHVDNFYFRAGLGYYGSPYENDFLAGGRTTYSGGIGVRGPKGFIDMALVQTTFNSGEYPYTLNYSNVFIAPEANLENSFTNVTLTFGLKF